MSLDEKKLPSLTAVYLMTDEELRQATANARDRLAELNREGKEREGWSQEKRLSIRLHETLCHNRDCDFYYQFGPSGTWENLYEPKRYLAMATALIQQFTPEQIEKFKAILGKGKL
jgi:hypothetical protein